MIWTRIEVASARSTIRLTAFPGNGADRDDGKIGVQLFRQFGQLVGGSHHAETMDDITGILRRGCQICLTYDR